MKTADFLAEYGFTPHEARYLAPVIPSRWDRAMEWYVAFVVALGFIALTVMFS